MDLGNEENWQQVLKGRKEIKIVQQVPGFLSYYPIPEFRIPIFSPIVKIQLLSESAKPHWFLGAWASLYLYAHTGYTLFGSKKCRINEDNLLIFDQPTEQIPYSLSLKIPKWIEDVDYEIWQYIDQSGRYSPSITLDKLIEAVEGQEITLKNVVWERIEGTDLIVSTFTESVKYSRFIVGRFTSIQLEQILDDPLVAVSPRQLVAQFTSTKQILPNTIKVQVNPI